MLGIRSIDARSPCHQLFDRSSPPHGFVDSISAYSKLVQHSLLRILLIHCMTAQQRRLFLAENKDRVMHPIVNVHESPQIVKRA